MSKAMLTLEQLLRSFPEERERLRPYLDKARSYSNDCGCSMGAAFLAGSLPGLIAYGFLSDVFDRANFLSVALWGTGFLFAASIVGKLTGIGIARIRLALLYRQLAAHFRVEGG